MSSWLVGSLYIDYCTASSATSPYGTNDLYIYIYIYIHVIKHCKVSLIISMTFRIFWWKSILFRSNQTQTGTLKY